MASFHSPLATAGTERFTSPCAKLNLMNGPALALLGFALVLPSTSASDATQLDRIERIVEANTRALGAVDQRLNAVDLKLGAVDLKLGAVDQRLDAVDRELQAVNRLIDANHRSINGLAASVNARFDALQDRHIAAETAGSTGFSPVAVLWSAFAASIGCVLTLVAEPIVRERRPS